MTMYIEDMKVLNESNQRYRTETLAPIRFTNDDFQP